MHPDYVLGGQNFAFDMVRPVVLVVSDCLPSGLLRCHTFRLIAWWSARGGRVVLRLASRLPPQLDFLLGCFTGTLISATRF